MSLRENLSAYRVASQQFQSLPLLKASGIDSVFDDCQINVTESFFTAQYTCPDQMLKLQLILKSLRKQKIRADKISVQHLTMKIQTQRWMQIIYLSIYPIYSGEKQ